MNANLSTEEKYRRIIKYHVPYHTILGELSEFIKPVHAISVHSFSPDYEGSIREVRVGVLHEDVDYDLAKIYCDEFNKAGYDARLNEPWSGKEGLTTVMSNTR
jgi:predicted N-formylglutamate amidohydrolase